MTWQIIGHEWAIALLRQSLATDQIAHAYLLTGPPQVGKTRLALSLAKALNCEQPDPPCGRCPACRKIDQGVHPDIGFIGDDNPGGSIKIDQIRALRREAVLSPYEGRYRVYILRRADRATIEAANSLLKILEEPPAHVVLTLTAVHPESLPPTVVSRCQRLDLRAVPLGVIEASLQERGLPAPDAQLLARLSGGRIGWAFSAGEDDAILRQRQQDLDLLIELLAASRVRRMDVAWKASRDPIGAHRQIEQWTTWWRDLLLLRCHSESHIINIDRIDELRSMAAVSDVRQVSAVLRVLQETTIQLDANVNARLALEGLLLSLPRWQAMPAVRV
jgi:DNA polymerase-3 subunit delta'